MLSLRFNSLFVHIPRTAGQSIEQVFLAAHGLAWEDRAALLLRPNDDPAQGPERLAHLFAREYVDCGHVTAEAFASLFKVSVVRNPYDRLISEFRYRRPRVGLHAFLDRAQTDAFSDRARHLAPQVDYLHDRQGRLLVDQLVRFERLAEEVAPLFERIFGRRVELPHANAAGAPISALDLRPALRRRIHRLYEADFDAFGYPSEPVGPR